MNTREARGASAHTGDISWHKRTRISAKKEFETWIPISLDNLTQLKEESDPKTFN
jgi:hypothetical protein